MYAVNHAATALVIKKKYSKVPLVPILLAVQLVEVMWVAFQFLGIEHISVKGDTVHLDYLPYSHSLLTGIGLGVIAWLILAKVFKRPMLGAAIGIGIASHILLDLTVHEPDIQIAPFLAYPRLGLNMYSVPLLAFLFETGYGILCWWIYKGSKKLLATIVLLNVLDIPFMFPSFTSGGASFLAQNPLIIAITVLIQILLSWLLIWLFGRQPAPVTKSSVEVLEGSLESD